MREAKEERLELTARRNELRILLHHPESNPVDVHFEGELADESHDERTGEFRGLEEEEGKSQFVVRSNLGE